MAEMPTRQIKTNNRPLSAKERFWSGHYRQWEQSDLSLAGYARAQGLVIKTFYGWHHRLKERGLAKPEPVAPIFHRVTVNHAELPPVVKDEFIPFRFQLPNGIRCETDLKPGDITGFLDRLSKLRL